MPRGRLDAAYDRSVWGLWADLFWFMVHSVASIALLCVFIAAITPWHPDPDSATAKLSACALALVVPMLGGFVMARIWGSRSWAWPARYVWVSGLLVLASAAVWVTGLPTGPGGCGGCGAAEKLWRTFFVVENGSGLLNGDGLLVGCWVPFAAAGYSLGATLGLRF